jgi:hypothetical protein
MTSHFRSRAAPGQTLHVLAAFSLLELIFCAVPFPSALADQSSMPSNVHSVQPEADARIASQLTEIERMLTENEGASFNEAPKVLVSVLSLLPTASGEGRRLVMDFPALLKKHATEERASGRWKTAMYLSAFADAAEPSIRVVGAEPSVGSVPAVGSEPEQYGAEQHSIPADRPPGMESAAREGQPGEPEQTEIPPNTAPAMTTAVTENPAPSSGDKGSDMNAGLELQAAHHDQEVPTTGGTGMPTSDDLPAGPAERPSGASSPVASPAVPQQRTEDSSPRPAGSGVAGRGQTASLPSDQPRDTLRDITRGLGTPKPQIAAPAVSPLPLAVRQTLLRRGDLMFGLGDVSAARLLFARAAEAGIGTAALKLGDTYNPAVLAERRLRGIRPDPAEAEAWYRKAEALGEAQAGERLKNLDDHRLATSSGQ